MRKCNCLLVKEMIALDTLMILWKTIWMKIPLHLHQKIEMVNDFYVITNRQQLQTCQLGFIWRAAVLWNDLHRELRTLLKFKRKLR